MKRLSIVFLFVFLLLGEVYSQIKINSYYDGYWETSWRTTSGCKIRGNYSGFIIFAEEDHPSKYFFKFQISNYVTPDASTLKYHRKSETWLQYTGTVEYYVSESFPTILDVLRKNHFPGITPTYGEGKQPVAKRVANATIKIAPYKDHPKVYNIWFDGVGVGIDLNNLYF